MNGLDFVAIDVETANHHRGSICALGLAVVRAGTVVATHSWLCKPPAGIDHFEPFHMWLHGITPESVADQPTFAERLDEALDIAGGLPVVAHNAGFDLSALRGACIALDRPWPDLNYLCTLVMARRTLDLISYRLPIVAEALGVDLESHHDAGQDALACARVLLAIAARHEADTLEELGKKLCVLTGRMNAGTWSGCRGHSTTPGRIPPQANPNADRNHPLYGSVMAFTGALSIVRRDAWAQVAALGADVVVSPNKKTDFLVIGDGFRGDNPAEFGTGKARKAAELRAKGHAIEVLTEEDFYKLLTEPTDTVMPAEAIRAAT